MLPIDLKKKIITDLIRAYQETMSNTTYIILHGFIGVYKMTEEELIENYLSMFEDSNLATYKELEAHLAIEDALEI